MEEILTVLYAASSFHRMFGVSEVQNTLVNLGAGKPMFDVNYFCRSCCLSQKCYSAIIVAIARGVEREEGSPSSPLCMKATDLERAGDVRSAHCQSRRLRSLLCLIYFASMMKDHFGFRELPRVRLRCGRQSLRLTRVGADISGRLQGSAGGDH